MNKKNILSKIGVLAAVFTLNAGLFVSLNKYAHKVEAYDASSLPTTIDLNDCNEQEIRSYYSNLNSLSVSQRQGTNLLKNLKTILSNGQKYYNYDSGSTVWQMYEITDRDWVKSPASSTTYGTYNASTNTITNYQYGTSNTNGKNNPYLHALYIDRDIDHQVKAWGNHNQDMWGINREHIWAKSHGFQDEGAGGARGDPMHLWAANGYANNIHSNYFYAFVDKTRSYEDCGDTYSSVPNNLRGYSKNIGGSEKVFEPQDSDKGDIARSIFYMVARYNNYANASSGFDTNNPNLVLLNDLSENGTTGTSSANKPYGMGLLRDLLAWNKLDPVDEYEIHRNNLLYKNYTNNRNPFIDFPNWADAIWGTANLDGTNYNSAITTSASPSTDPLNVIESNTFSISSHNIELEVDETAEIYATNASGNISWSISDNTVASLNKTSTTNNEKVTITALKGGTTNITATNGGNSVACTVTVGEVVNYGTLDNPLSVDKAITLINNSQNNVPDQPLYVKGIVTSNSAYNTQYYNFDEAWLQSDDGSNPEAFELFRFKLDSGVTGDYTAQNSMKDKQVVAYGYAKKYNGTPELATSNNAPKNPIVYEISDIEPTAIKLNQDTASVDVGDTVTLTASLIPSKAVGTIVWESSDTSIATVNNGVVTGVRNGQATITARVSEFDLEAECIVTVSGGVVVPSDYLNNATSVAELRATETKQSSVVTKSLTFANAGLANAADITNVPIGAVTLNGEKGTNSSNNPKYYTSGYNMRVYAGNKITFTCDENMTRIVFTYTDSYATGLSASTGTLSGTTWTGNTKSVSFTNGGGNQVRITAVEITYGAEAVEVSEVKLDFGFDISVADWTAITTNWEVTDYGVMLFKSTKTTFSSSTPVKDAFELGYMPAIIHEGTKELELGGEGYYSYRGTVDITSVANYGLTFMAAPFICADGQYYFFEERQESVYSLAEYYKTHSGCELSYNALLTILANQGE